MTTTTLDGKIKTRLVGTGADMLRGNPRGTVHR